MNRPGKLPTNPHAPSPFEAPQVALQVRRACPECQQVFPEGVFLKQEGERIVSTSFCPACTAEKPEKERARREAQQKLEQWRKQVKQLDRVNAANISELNAALIDKFGGLAEFASFYYGQISAAATKDGGAGSSRVLLACGAVAKIIHQSTEHQANVPSVPAMTDEQLAEEFQRGLLTMINAMDESERDDLLSHVEPVADEPRQIPGVTR